MITEPKQINSGTPQGAFLKRQVVVKQDGSDMPFEPLDFKVGLDIGLCGRAIRIYDADEYTRSFFTVSQFIFIMRSNNVTDFIIDKVLMNSFPNIELRCPSK